MEKIDIRDCFPVINGGDGVILSKNGDICIGWEISLPPAFRCNEEKYDSIVRSFSSAIALLPDYSIVHKQDIFMKKQYRAADAKTFLETAYENHFDGREYLDHISRLFLVFSSPKNIKGGSSGLLGISSRLKTKPEEINRCMLAADQFETIVQSNPLLEMRRLREIDIFGDESTTGIMQDFLNFTDRGQDSLSDMEMSHKMVKSGDKCIVCHLIADLDQLPSEVSSCRKVASLSTENSSVNLSLLYELGQNLNCEHIVNHFILKEPQKDIYGSLDAKRRTMLSMSLKSAENRMYSEEIGNFLEEAAAKQMTAVKCHINILSGGTAEDIETIKDKVTASISKTGITPVYDIYDTPRQFWASIPGNEASLRHNDYMTMELESALCIGLYDGLESGIEGGVLKMSDRQTLVPVRFDIQEKAFEAGLIENYNMFLLGPSGSGKSFFMNKYLWSCYLAGQHCFLIDVGDSYNALCHIINESSRGKDGRYYTFEKGKPISFNPFRNIQRFRNADSEAMNFLFALMCFLWKNGKEEISSSGLKFVKDSISSFVSSWHSDCDPVFNDYFVYVRDVFSRELTDKGIGKEYFDIRDYMISLEQFYEDGTYGYLLNCKDNIDILNDRFVVFEIDHIKGEAILYPVTTLVIMDAFMEKMTSNSDFKVMVIEEAWKAIMGTHMATYMMELWKTARKHRTSAVVVTQELKDITSSSIIKDTIVENSAVKILLDQTKYLNRFETLAQQLSLSEDDKSMVLSLNRLPVADGSGREVFFNLGNKKSFVMRLEVSPEERIAFSSQKKDKERLAKEVAKTGSHIKAISAIAQRNMKNT